MGPFHLCLDVLILLRKVSVTFAVYSDQISRINQHNSFNYTKAINLVHHSNYCHSLDEFLALKTELQNGSETF